MSAWQVRVLVREQDGFLLFQVVGGGGGGGGGSRRRRRRRESVRPSDVRCVVLSLERASGQRAE